MAIREPAHAYIVQTPGICGGRPAVKGTRITVPDIAFRHRRGESVDETLEAWPHLTPAQVHAALSYYYDHQSQIDAEVELSLDEAYWQGLYPAGRPSEFGGEREY